MNAKAATPALRVIHRYAAPPERVFDAWLDPALAARFLFATPNGTMVRAEIDARVGGRYTFVDRRDGTDVLHAGEYVEIDRPRRLVFTFAVPRYDPRSTRLTVEISPVTGGCELALAHDGVAAEHAGRSAAGWATILGQLGETLRSAA